MPYELILETSLFGYLEGLTSIQPYPGWHNTGSSGEAEALEYVAGKLDEFSNTIILDDHSFNSRSAVK